MIPKTSVLGAILLTGYLGGATAANVRAGSAEFNTIFPIIVSVLVWVGLFLREGRLRLSHSAPERRRAARRFAPLRAYDAVHSPDQPCIPRRRFFPFSTAAWHLQRYPFGAGTSLLLHALDIVALLGSLYSFPGFHSVVAAKAPWRIP